MRITLLIIPQNISTESYIYDTDDTQSFLSWNLYLQCCKTLLFDIEGFMVVTGLSHAVHTVSGQLGRSHNIFVRSTIIYPHTNVHSPGESKDIFAPRICYSAGIVLSLKCPVGQCLVKSENKLHVGATGNEWSGNALTALFPS